MEIPCLHPSIAMLNLFLLGECIRLPIYDGNTVFACAIHQVCVCSIGMSCCASIMLITRRRGARWASHILSWPRSHFTSQIKSRNTRHLIYGPWNSGGEHRTHSILRRIFGTSLDKGIEKDSKHVNKTGRVCAFLPFYKNKIAQEEEEERIIKQTNCVMHQLLKRITKCTDSKHAIGKTDK